MIKISLVIFSLIISCSSLPDKVYQRSAIEKQADRLMKTADLYRNERQYKTAKKYYSSAAELYRGKADHQKYLISQIRLADLSLKTNAISDFEKVFNHIIEVNQQEKLNQNNAIDYLRAKRFYKDKKTIEANNIVDRLIDYFDADEEKYAYYSYLKAEHNPDKANIEKLDDIYTDLIDLFEDGELNSIEILSYCSLVRAQLTVGQNRSNSVEKLRKTEKLFQKLEQISRLNDLYGLFAIYYKENKQIKQADYYSKRQLDTKNMLNKNSN